MLYADSLLCFNLSFNSLVYLFQHLDLLLSQICGIMEKHTELPVLQACAQLASTLCSDCYTFSSRAHLVFSQLLDSLLECFNTYLSGLLQVRVFRHSVAWILAWY